MWKFISKFVCFQALFNRFLTCTMEGYIIKHNQEIWIEIYMDFECTYVGRITKICKFNRKLDCFTPYLRKRKGVQFAEQKDTRPPPSPVTAHTTHTPKLSLCYHFEEK